MEDNGEDVSDNNNSGNNNININNNKILPNKISMMMLMMMMAISCSSCESTMMTIPVRIMASGEDVSDNNNKILPSTRRKVLSASWIKGGKMHWSSPATSH